MEVIKNYKKTRNTLFKHAGISPQSNFISTKGPVKRVHFLELGNGDPLILIHGGLSHSSEWINILKPLSEHFKLFVIDRPGHGLTEAMNYDGIDYYKSAVDFLATFMDSVGLTQAHLLGNSMGGYFSNCFALEYPQRVKKLVFIGAPAGWNKWIPPVLRLLGTKGLNKLVMMTIAKPSVRGVKDIHKQLLVVNADQLSDDYFQHCYYNSLLPGAKITQRTMLENVLTFSGWRKELNLVDKLQYLKVPVYLLWGDKDAFESPKTGLKKAAEIVNHKFRIIKNAGHCPWLDQPNECANLIIEILQK